MKLREKFENEVTQKNGGTIVFHEMTDKKYIAWLENLVLENKLNKMPKSLTAENGAKGLLIGEFFETIELYDEESDELYTQKVPIEWTTIKEIYSKIVEHFTKP